MTATGGLKELSEFLINVDFFPISQFFPHSLGNRRGLGNQLLERMQQAVDEDAHEAANAEDDEDDLERRVLIEAEFLRLYAKQRAERLPGWGEAPVDVEIAWERAELVAARAVDAAAAAAAQDAGDAAAAEDAGDAAAAEDAGDAAAAQDAGDAAAPQDAADAAAAEDAGDAAAGEDAADAAAAERIAVIAQRIADQPSARQVAENFQCRQRIEARAYCIMEERRQERAVDDEAARFLAQMETARHDSCISAASLLIRHRHHDPNGVEAELIQEALRAADAAKEEAMAAQVATDAAFAAQLAADDVGAAGSKDSLV